MSFTTESSERDSRRLAKPVELLRQLLDQFVRLHRVKIPRHVELVAKIREPFVLIFRRRILTKHRKRLATSSFIMSHVEKVRTFRAEVDDRHTLRPPELPGLLRIHSAKGFSSPT